MEAQEGEILPFCITTLPSKIAQTNLEEHETNVGQKTMTTKRWQKIAGLSIIPGVCVLLALLLFTTAPSHPEATQRVDTSAQYLQASQRLLAQGKSAEALAAAEEERWLWRGKPPDW